LQSITDIVSTILEATGVKAPKVIDGVEQMAFDGSALNYSVSDPKAKDSRTVQYYELFGNSAIYAELFINDKSVGKIHIAKTVPITYSIEETFDVGEAETGSDQGRTQLTAA
jgi:arylsulfatase A-like enzyme